jgi:hypothetical protein
MTIAGRFRVVVELGEVEVGKMARIRTACGLGFNATKTLITH